jgi:ParB-like chromosome segregation protein Spo0J
MKITNIKINEIKLNPNNPRLIKDDKFAKLVKSIKDFPEMLNIRPIVVNDNMVILGGNMRYKACKEAGLKEVPIIKASGLSEEKQREFLIKDNISGGEWDYDILANEWDELELEEWGLLINNFDNNNLLFNDNDGDKENNISNEPKSSDDNYSTFELIMLHENKLELLDTLNKVKNEFLFEKQEDALMEILRIYNKK